MNANEAVLSVLAVLEELQVPYMVTGSYAANVFGLPRSTKDADLIVEAEASRIHEVLDRLVAPLRPDPQMLFETITSSRRWIVRLDHSPFVIEIFLLNNHPFDRSRFTRRRREPVLPDVNAWLPTPEDVIVQKLRWVALSRRAKDFEDACNVMAVQGSALDWDYIVKWCAELDAAEVLEEARQKTGC